MHARMARTLLGVRWRGRLWFPVVSVAGLRPALPRALRLRRWFYRRQILEKGTRERAAVADSGRPPPKVKVMAVWEAGGNRKPRGRSLPEPARAGRRDLSAALTA